MVRRNAFTRDDAAELWERPAMRLAAMRRDIAALYRALQRVGVSQRLIAAQTGQSLS